MNTERKPTRYDAANTNPNTRRPYTQLNEHEKSDFKSSRIPRPKYELDAGINKNTKYSKNNDTVGASNDNDDSARESRYDRTSYRPRRYDNDEKGKDYVNGGNTNSRYGRGNYTDRYENDRKDSNGNRALSNGKGVNTNVASKKPTSGSVNTNTNTNTNQTERHFRSRSDHRRTGENTTTGNATPALAHTANPSKRDEPHDKPVNKVIIHYKSDIASGSTWSKEKSGPTFADMVRMKNEAKAKAANADKTTL